MLGNHIVEELLTGKLAMAMGVKEVRLFDVKPFVRLGDLSFERTRPDNKKIVLKRITGDITNLADVKSAVQGCNAVIHACSVVDFGNIPKNVIWKVNVDGTKNVLREAAKAGVQSFIYTSSLDVVLPDKLPGLLNADESAPYAEKSQHSMYVKSKPVQRRHAFGKLIIKVLGKYERLCHTPVRHKERSRIISSRS